MIAAIYASLSSAKPSGEHYKRKSNGWVVSLPG